ncbi:MAG: ROK family protein [Candidatus Acidiferrales bacterium]
MGREAGRTVLGVDIGGTKVAAGIVSSAGEILLRERTRMAARGTAEEGLAAVFEAIDAALRARAARNVRAIGVTVPGWVDAAKGSVTAATNLPCWRNFPLAAKIQSKYRLPVRIANDANAAALAEATWGAGAGCPTVFYATLGTGVGTGIVFDGKIFEGRTGAAGEGGHATIDFRGPLCGCGKRGCIEVYASGTGIARRAREQMAERGARAPQLKKLARAAGGEVTAEIISRAAREGDRLAIEVLEESADRLAIWLGNIIDLLDPDVLVIGGGVGHLMMTFEERIRAALKIWAVNPRQDEVALLAAHYGSESALVGAGALVLPRLRNAGHPAARQKNPRASRR